MSGIKDYMQTLGEGARSASAALRKAQSHDKNSVLLGWAVALDDARDQLVEANKLDVQAGADKGLSDALLDRLLLNDERIDGMIEGLKQVAALNDPVGEISDLSYQPSGIQVGKMRVPIGVVGMIYESRPNVTVEAASLCLKSGNAIILRGGSEAIHSNRALAEILSKVLAESALPSASVQLVVTTDREAVGYLIAMPEFVDVIIPRGGKGLIERITADARVPVIKHLDGICHTYIDEDANREMAVDVTVNAKTQRFGTCNTTETILVHRSCAQDVLPELVAQLSKHGVEIRGCAAVCSLIPTAKRANEEDWSTEYLAPIVSIRLVESFEAAVNHIETYSSRHTEAIITDNYATARRFLAEVDSSSVMVNASTRFADGFEYGLGAEIGISTDKFHARGPVGLEGLTSQKWIVFGNGHKRG